MDGEAIMLRAWLYYSTMTETCQNKPVVFGRVARVSF